MDYEKPTLKDVTPKTVIVREYSNIPEEEIESKIIEAINEIMQDIATPQWVPSDIVLDGPPMLIHIPTIGEETETLSFQLGYPIVSEPKETETLKIIKVKGGKVISMDVFGAYQEYHGKLHQILYDYAGAHHRLPAGEIREIFHNDPEKTPTKDLRTELQLPVK